MALNGYSMQVRDVMLAAFPLFADDSREQSDGTWLIESRSPSGSQFWASTEGDEVTVGFDAHHIHFGTSWDPHAEEDAEQAINYIRKLMGEEYRIAVWSRQGKFVQSETVERGVDPAHVSRSWIGRWWLKGCSVEVKKWISSD